MARTETVEREFLERAAVDHEAFVEHVLARLELGEELYGDQWARRSVRDLLGELLEEAADLGAWGALTQQVLATEMPGRASIAALVDLAAYHGARAHEALTLAIGSIR